MNLGEFAILEGGWLSDSYQGTRMPADLLTDASRRLEKAAHYTPISENATKRRKFSKASFKVAIPVRMDDV